MDNLLDFVPLQSRDGLWGHETLLAGDLDQFNRWDLLVDRSPAPDVYYRPGYALANEATGLGLATAAVVSTRKQRYLFPFLRKALPEFAPATNMARFDVATPYGYGGVLPLDFVEVDERELQDLLDALKSWCLSQRIVSCYIRLHPTMDQKRWVNAAKQRTDMHVMAQCPTIAIDLSEWDTVNNQIVGMRRRRRKDLSRAREELKASWSITGIEQFQELYTRSMDRLHAKAWCRFSPDYYQVLATKLPGKWHLLSIHRQDRLVGMALNLFDALYLHGHLVGITEEGTAYGASTFAYNEGAAWARSNGLESFHVGPGRTEGDALYDFKNSFGGMKYPCWSVGLIADHDAYVTLCRLRCEQIDLPEPRSDFFPFYRA